MGYSFSSSNIGRKVIMSLTGIALIFFLIAHLAGNLLLYVSKDVFNLYSHKLTSNPFIYVLEAILLLGFLTHVYEGIVLSIKSKKARGKSYKVKKTFGKSNLLSSNMLLSGSIIFIFLVLHIKSFKFGESIYYEINEQKIRDLYTIVVEHFQSPIYSLFYLLAISLLSAHLIHGSLSAWKTLGVHNKKYAKMIRNIGIIFSVFIWSGFSSIPLYFLLFHS